MALADELYRLYAARIYPVLVDNDPEYQRSLFKAGLGWNPSNPISPVHRASFEEEMRMQAWLAVCRIEDAKSLQPNTVRADLVNGPQVLYRVADSSVPKGRPGIWWFSERVAERCRDAAGADPQARLDWLRNVLAVCFNWSGFDRIERFAMHSGEQIPAVLGYGLPMPFNKLTPYVDRKTGEHMVTIPPDYWRTQGMTLLGGEPQIVLPWIPVGRIKPTASL